jgi:ribonuclease HI
MLVVEQVNGRWKINNETLRKLRTEAYGLLVRGGHTLEHVKGHDGNKGNEEADRLCNEAMDRYEKPLVGQVMD